jgi:hypothetical protein
MTMRDMCNAPKDPHPDEPDELTPDTLPLDDIERRHDGSTEGGAGGRVDSGEESGESSAKDLDEPGTADRTPRP